MPGSWVRVPPLLFTELSASQSLTGAWLVGFSGTGRGEVPTAVPISQTFSVAGDLSSFAAMSSHRSRSSLRGAYRAVPGPRDHAGRQPDKLLHVSRTLRPMYRTHLT